jgi:uncharacterized protein
MDQPDFERARQYALERLERELPPILYYHSLAHTRDDVVPAAERLAALEGVDGQALLLLRTAAFYHDLGHIEQYTNHETIGIWIAAQVLPHFGYSATHVQVISGMIMATQLPQSPRTLLEEIMADADLDVLGRDDFLNRNQDLRDERAALGVLTTDEEWYSGQLEFIQTHRYFTAAARTLRDARKQQNIEELIKLLEDCQAQGG